MDDHPQMCDPRTWAIKCSQIRDVAVVAFLVLTAVSTNALADQKQSIVAPVAGSSQESGAVGQTVQSGQPKSASAWAPPVSTSGSASPSLTLSCSSTSQEKCSVIGFVDAVAWPLVAILVLAALILSSNLRRVILNVLRYIKKFKGGPVEFEFSDEAAKDVSASVATDLKIFIAAARSEYDRQARAHNIDQLLESAVDEIFSKRRKGDRPKNLRATLHVPDLVFEGQLYQMVNYQPDASGRGRRWSERYGILGRSWRLGRSLFTDYAMGHEKADAAETTGDAERMLICNWGMNRFEAKRGSNRDVRQSYLCVVLRTKTERVGVLYMDATDKGAFSDFSKDREDPANMEADPTLESLQAVMALAEAVSSAMKALRPGGAYIDIEAQEWN